MENQHFEQNFSHFYPDNFTLKDIPNDFSLENQVGDSNYNEITNNINNESCYFPHQKINYNFYHQPQNTEENIEINIQQYENCIESPIKYQNFAQLFLNSQFDVQENVKNSPKEDSNSKINFSNQQQSNDYSSQENISCDNKNTTQRTKLTSTNITKNYISGMLLYIDNNKEEILEWAKRENLNFKNPQQFFNNNLKCKKKKLYSMKHLKKLLGQNNTFGKIYRTFGYQFLQKEAQQFIYGGKIKDKSNVLKFRHSIKQAFHDPENFSKLIL